MGRGTGIEERTQEGGGRKRAAVRASVTCVEGSRRRALPSSEIKKLG
jgi:hypothetical protein